MAEGVSSGRAMCPSAPPRPGAVLLGVIGPSGRVAYVPTGPRVDAPMLEALTEDDPAAGGYRFAATCFAAGCVYWEDGRCHVPDKVRHDRAAAGLAPADVDARLPDCAIRESCRWWAQEGRAACALCPLVATRTA